MGDINTETWYSRLRVGQKADDLALKKYTVAKEVKSGSNLAGSSKEDWPKKGCFADDDDNDDDQVKINSCEKGKTVPDLRPVHGCFPCQYQNIKL
jgi:hypothetical protein